MRIASLVSVWLMVIPLSVQAQVGGNPYALPEFACGELHFSSDRPDGYNVWREVVPKVIDKLCGHSPSKAPELVKQFSAFFEADVRGLETAREVELYVFRRALTAAAIGCEIDRKGSNCFEEALRRAVSRLVNDPYPSDAPQIFGVFLEPDLSVCRESPTCSFVTDVEAMLRGSKFDPKYIEINLQNRTLIIRDDERAR